MCYKVIKNRIKLYIYQHTHKITPRGTMLMHYIIDKYINCTRKDFIESYEKDIVEQATKYIDFAAENAAAVKEQFHMKQDLDTVMVKIAQTCGAINLLKLLLLSMKPVDRIDWYDAIKDKATQNKIKCEIDQFYFL